MRYEELFKLIPSLDSIVRFEGEYTFLELVNLFIQEKIGEISKALRSRKMAKLLQILSVRLRMDLDKFPYPDAVSN